MNNPIPEPNEARSPKIRALTPDQQKQLYTWRFDYGFTLEQIAALCLKEFEVKIAVSILGRHFQNPDRQPPSDPPDSPASATVSPNSPPQPEATSMTPSERYDAILDAIERRALKLCKETDDQVKMRDLAAIVHLLIAARREASEAARVSLARERFEYDIATECLIHKVSMDRICADESMDEAQKIYAIRKELFGPNLPD